MNKEITELTKRLEVEISNTPTGDLRNLLCDVNIMLQTLNTNRFIDCEGLDPDFIRVLNQLVKTQTR